MPLPPGVLRASEQGPPPGEGRSILAGHGIYLDQLFQEGATLFLHSLPPPLPSKLSACRADTLESALLTSKHLRADERGSVGTVQASGTPVPVEPQQRDTRTQACGVPSVL